MARFKRAINNKRDFFNFVPRKHKESIRELILMGYTVDDYLISTIWECRIGLQFTFSKDCLSEITEHYINTSQT